MCLYVCGISIFGRQHGTPGNRYSHEPEHGCWVLFRPVFTQCHGRLLGWQWCREDLLYRALWPVSDQISLTATYGYLTLESRSHTLPSLSQAYCSRGTKNQSIAGRPSLCLDFKDKYESSARDLDIMVVCIHSQGSLHSPQWSGNRWQTAKQDG